MWFLGSNSANHFNFGCYQNKFKKCWDIIFNIRCNQNYLIDCNNVILHNECYDNILVGVNNADLNINHSKLNNSPNPVKITSIEEFYNDGSS